MKDIRAILLDLISNPPAKRTPYLIAIDGRCGAGKTTLALFLHQRTGVPVVPMDDFFLRPEQRTEERRRTPGENVDHERFLEEVLLPLSKGEEARYRPFDCHTLSFLDDRTIRPDKVVLVEGSYALNRNLRSYYDRTVFLDVDKKEQERRLLQREGVERFAAFRTRWIPLEENYIEKEGILDKADIVATL